MVEALDALDTPAMLVDVEAMDRNVARFMARFRGGSVSVRPHLKTVKSPLLARRLLDAGARGVCVAKLSEAEVMAAAGIEVWAWPPTSEAEVRFTLATGAAGVMGDDVRMIARLVREQGGHEAA